MVSLLLSVTFACGLLIAIAHVLNRRFVAPVYDVMANLTSFGCAVAASLLLSHWTPALLSAIAILCWLVLARRTILARRKVVVQHDDTQEIDHPQRENEASSSQMQVLADGTFSCRTGR